MKSSVDRRKFSGCGALLCVLMMAGLACAAPVTGVVTNKTNNKPAGGDDVVLLKLAQGMQELARAKTDAKGRFTIEVPGDGLHLLRVTHDKANYFKPVQPGTATVDVDVYSAATTVEGITLDADVMRIQTEPGGAGLRVVEHFFMKNESSPAKTLFSDHPFELYLPAGATVEGSAAKAPGGMAVQSPLVPLGDATHYTIIFPIRPGETEFQITYKLPYKDSFTFQPRPVMPIDTIAVMMPKSMTFKQGVSTPYTAVTEELGAQTYVARNVQPSQPLEFTVSGKGELPRDTPVTQGADGGPGAGGTQPGGGAAADAANASVDTRPGGGLGVPVDKDAQRDPWTKYRWWIIAGLALVFAAAAGFMLKSPASGVRAQAAVGAGGAAGMLPGSSGALQVLRDEMFAVETERLEGKVSDAQYRELKAAYDVVLRRTLARSQAG